MAQEGSTKAIIAALIANLGIAKSATGDEIAQAIDSAEANVRNQVPVARVIYLEPDIARVSV